MARISQKTIEEIKSAADILDVVGEYVALQPSGKNYKGLCPFHNEKTPSFFVSKERGSFHCFGCGEKGDSINFIQKFKNISYVEALEFLAEKYHIEIERVGSTEIGVSHDRYFRINQEAMEFYQLHLTNLEKGKNALEYLKQRGLDVHTIRYFEIGYAPADGDALYQHLKTKYEEIDLLTIGLINKNQSGGYYDLFRDRIVFPIKDESGHVVGFSSRLYEDKENEPKYVNSPFTEIFTKGEIMYNLDRAQSFIRRDKRVVLYEGFMDVIASVKSGVKAAICSMGTQLTQNQARLIKRYTDKVLLCYDGDNAGFEAMAKAIKLLMAEAIEVEIILLPEGMDPDDFVRKKGQKAFSDYLAQKSIDVYDFLYEYMKKDIDLTKPRQIEAFKLKVFDFLIQKNSATISDLFMRRIGQDIKIDFETIRSDFQSYQLTKAITRSLQERKTSQTGYKFTTAYEKAELILLNYYLENVDFRNKIKDELSIFTEDRLNFEIQVNIDELEKNTDQAALRNRVISVFSDDKQQEVTKRLTLDHDEFTEIELEQCIQTLKCRKIDRDINRIKSEIEALDPDDQSMKIKLKNDEVQLRKALQAAKEKVYRWTKIK
ncbi:MAG: DNA primase [Bacilli bacterium]|nr:DNA primase [Bacilli bacterium]MBN2696911.1 DNA primase [Bacilli bacterium]